MKAPEKKIVLVVEDDATTASALLSQLESAGLGVLVARDGRAGLALALEKHPDLILLDLQMPKMDGRTMFMELSRDQWGMSVPVIILTTTANPDIIVQTVRDGVSDYLVKADHSIHDVVKKVKERLGHIF